VGEACTAFVMLLQGNGEEASLGCPSCHTEGEYVLFENLKQCMCSEGFGFGDVAGCSNPLRDAVYVQVHQNVCVDLDECLRNDMLVANAREQNKTERSLCPQQATACRNIFGSFECICSEGLDTFLEGDEYTCSDTNKCTSSKRERCAVPFDGGRCINTDCSYFCTCLEGYRGTGLVDGGYIDIDEFKESSHSCATTQSCVNTFGSFNCLCPKNRPTFLMASASAKHFWKRTMLFSLGWEEQEVQPH